MLLVAINVKYFEFFSGMMDIDNICRQCSGISVAREIDLSFERPLNYVTILNQKFAFVITNKILSAEKRENFKFARFKIGRLKIVRKIELY